MNETMSVVLATAILAIGGLGLYMYKQSDGLDFGDDGKIYDDKSDDDKSYDDKSYDDKSYDDRDENFDYEEDFDHQDGDTYSEDLNNYEPRIRSRGKTKRAKTSKGTKKRKY
jgi:hypothetical protein